MAGAPGRLCTAAGGEVGPGLEHQGHPGGGQAACRHLMLWGRQLSVLRHLRLLGGPAVMTAATLAAEHPAHRSRKCDSVSA